MPLPTTVKREPSPPPEVWPIEEPWIPKIQQFVGDLTTEQVTNKLLMEIMTLRSEAATTVPPSAILSTDQPSWSISQAPSLDSSAAYGQQSFDNRHLFLHTINYNTNLFTNNALYNDSFNSNITVAPSEMSIFNQHLAQPSSIPTLGSTPRLPTNVSINPQVLQFQVPLVPLTSANGRTTNRPNRHRRSRLTPILMQIASHRRLSQTLMYSFSSYS